MTPGARHVVARSMLPAVCLIGFLILVLAWDGLHLPRQSALLDSLRVLFAEYGLIIVFPAAFLEGFVILGLYFPGSAIVVLGVVLNRSNPPAALIVCLEAAGAFWLGAQLGFLLGRRGMRPLVERIAGGQALVHTDAWYGALGPRAILIACVHPNLGSLMALSCGSRLTSWTQFARYSLAGYLAWCLFWGIVVVAGGSVVEGAISSPIGVLVFLGAWTMVTVAVAIVQEFDLEARLPHPMRRFF